GGIRTTTGAGGVACGPATGGEAGHRGSSLEDVRIDREERVCHASAGGEARCKDSVWIAAQGIDHVLYHRNDRLSIAAARCARLEALFSSVGCDHVKAIRVSVGVEPAMGASRIARTKMQRNQDRRRVGGSGRREEVSL